MFLVQGVETTEGRGNPVAPHLGHHHLETGMAVEHAAEHQLPQGSPATQVGEEVLVEHAATERGREVHHVAAALLDLGDGRFDRAVRETLVEPESAVHHEGETALLVERPQRLVEVVVVGRHAFEPAEARRELADEAMVGDPVDLLHRGVEVRIRTACAHQQEPVGGRPELVGEPPVVRAHTGVDEIERMGPVHRVEAQFGRSEVALEDELGGDALTIHLREPDVGVPEASPLP